MSDRPNPFDQPTLAGVVHPLRNNRTELTNGTAARWGADRERQIIALRLASPKRGIADQHDASDLSLFRAVSEPGLL